uniref:RecQ mediated genome instability protein 1-like N-terminal helical domain-containing protein n=1 Tax=Panagrolaimus sp. JU765 TaxID=591449 RepID=A0AC34REE9_9BILA
MEDKALVDEVRKYFSDRHLFLKNDWETEAIRYVKLNLGKLQKNSSHFDIAEAVFQQFLYSDLKDSLVPSLRIPKVAKKFNIVKPFIFQVVSVVDVSEPLFSQFRERKFADDDSIFQDPSEGSFELVTEVSKNTRVLKVELSDGEMILNGIVTENIEDLDTRTPPGTKVRFFHYFSPKCF